MLHSIFASRRRAWLAFAAAMLLLAGVAFLLERQQFARAEGQAERAAQRELNLLASVVAEALRRGQFQSVEQLLAQWGESNPDLVQLRAIAKNGAVLGSYSRSTAAARTFVTAVPIEYSYHGEAVVDLTFDLAELDRHAASLRLQLLAVWLALALLSGFLVYMLMVRQREAETLRLQAQDLDAAFGALKEESAQRQRVEEERGRLVAMLEVTPDFVSIAGTDGIVTYLNRAGRAMVGIGLDAELGMPLSRMHPAWATDKVMATGILGALEKGVWQGETALLRPDGSEIPVSQVILVHRDESGQVRFYSTIARDITERQRLATELGRLNAELEQRVAQRTAELSAANAQLHEAMATLQRAQDELVRSEKLSSLGSLVAGVAHELNTPLGNSVTVATTLADRIRQFSKEVESNSVRRSSLADFMDFLQKASAILMSSLFAASELIGNFKQVAVDQTSAQRRPFDLAEVMGEVAMTLQPRFKATPHKMQVAVPAGIQMDSFPGPLGQVLTNLVGNALVHGFAGHGGGTVRIEATAAGDHVRLVVADDGNGIARENLGRIFDPFFTTRLGQGGSGLGLHIVYSIVVRVLGGRIDVTSEPGRGTAFTLVLPLSAPEDAGAELGTAIALGKA